MSKLEDIRRKVTAATAEKRAEHEAREVRRREESKIYAQFEADYRRKEARQEARDKELHEKYPAVKDAYEQYLMVKKMCESAEPKRRTTLEDIKKAFKEDVRKRRTKTQNYT